MQKVGKLEHAAKIVLLCLPPVVMSLVGLAALSRKKCGDVVIAGRKPAPTPGTARRGGTG